MIVLFKCYFKSAQVCSIQGCSTKTCEGVQDTRDGRAWSLCSDHGEGVGLVRIRDTEHDRDPRQQQIVGRRRQASDLDVGRRKRWRSRETIA